MFHVFCAMFYKRVCNISHGRQTGSQVHKGPRIYLTTLKSYESQKIVQNKIFTQMMLCYYRQDWLVFQCKVSLAKLKIQFRQPLGQNIHSIYNLFNLFQFILFTIS